MAEIVMPRLSDTMEEGTILRWLERRRRAGAAAAQELVEIETDKANMTYESDQEGVLQIVAAEGDTLPVGALIARVGVASRCRYADARPTAKNDDEPASSRLTCARSVRAQAGASPVAAAAPEGCGTVPTGE